MPKLHIFAFCEKVIMDENKNPSLIVLIENINVQPRQGEIPRDAVTPREWAIFTQWVLSEEEQTKPYVQVVQAFWPDGKEFNKTAHPLPTAQAATKQINMGVIGMPVGQEGKVAVKLWLELESHPVTEVFVKYLNVIQLRE